MTRKTWFELSSEADVGTRVVFVEAWDIFPECIVPAGTMGIVTQNGLNEIWGGLDVLPDDPQLRATLDLWGGNICLSTPDPGADGATDEAWQSLSAIGIQGHGQ
jgi:hypothetical protein